MWQVAHAFARKTFLPSAGSPLVGSARAVRPVNAAAATTRTIPAPKDFSIMRVDMEEPSGFLGLELPEATDQGYAPPGSAEDATQAGSDQSISVFDERFM